MMPSRVRRFFSLLISFHHGVIGLGIGIDRCLQFFAQAAPAGRWLRSTPVHIARRPSCRVTWTRPSWPGRRPWLRCGCRTASAGRCRRRRQLFDKGLDSGAQPADRHLSAHHRRQTIFQNQRRVEVLHLQKPFGRLLQRLLRNQADNLAARPAPRRSARLRASPFRTREGLGSARNRSGSSKPAPCPRTRNPAPFTKRMPPVEKRTALAIFLAMSTSGVFRKTLYAIRALRAPTTVAPADG